MEKVGIVGSACQKNLFSIRQLEFLQVWLLARLDIKTEFDCEAVLLAIGPKKSSTSASLPEKMQAFLDEFG
jgi:hypothetical protein